LNQKWSTYFSIIQKISKEEKLNVMKKIILIISLLLTLGCSENEKDLDNNNLIGTWELIKFENSDTGDFSEPPESADKILITFKESEFQGTTGRNNYFGKYKTNPPKLIFSEFGITEIGESEWGTKFSNAIVQTYDQQTQIFDMQYLIKGTLLKLEYDNSEFLVFEKL